ncbi:MAG: Orn/Lys/Arg decarboxylase N-terminal domain-containing protein, partial [Plesiomonas shigelloides]
MNIVAILSNVDAYFKEAPLQELDIELQKRGFHVIYPSDAADLLKVIENNPRICGVI